MPIQNHTSSKIISVSHLLPTPDTSVNLSIKALTTIINLCLTGKTSGFERPRAPMLQILWGVVNQAHIDYAERMWEEFTQSIHTYKRQMGGKKLAQRTLGKKKATLILIPSIRFKKLIIFHLQRLHNFHPRPDSPLHLPTEEPVLVIRGADYYDAYLEKVAKHQRYIAGEELSDPESPAPKPAKPTKQAKPKATEQPTVSKTKAKKSKHAPAKPKEKKRKPVSECPEAQLILAKRAKAGKGKLTLGNYQPQPEDAREEEKKGREDSTILKMPTWIICQRCESMKKCHHG
ncbi:hypothetical protein Tco_1404546 [Tanacetum coccineum]